jgi:hypothetical protein
MEKTLDNVNIADAQTKVSDIKVFGDGDMWQLLCKASSESQGWMKSTKAMQLPGGCLVQVTTQQGGQVSEAVTFVPGVKIHTLYQGTTPQGRYLVSDYVDPAPRTQKPAVGRVVHYVAFGSPGGKFPSGLCRSAQITEVYAVGDSHPEGGTFTVGPDGFITDVGLFVANPTGQYFARGIPYDAEKKPGTWHWPERV